MSRYSAIISSTKINAIGYVAAFGVNAVATLIASPLLAAGLGTTWFGIFKTLQKLIDFAGAADGRPTQALKWVIAKLQGDGTDIQRQQAVGSALLTWFKFLPLLLLCASVLVWLAPQMISSVTASASSQIRLVAAILAFNVVLTPLMAIPDAVLAGVHKGYKSLFIQSGWLLIANLAMVLAAVNGYGLTGVSIAALLVFSFNGVTVLFVARAEVPWLRARRPTKEADGLFFKFSTSLFGWALVEKALLATELILIARLIGPDMVTKYVFSSYAYQTGLALCLFAGASVMPGIGALIGASDMALATQAVNTTRQIVRFLALTIACFALLFNELFVTHWAGHTNYVGKWENLWLAILFMQLASLRTDAQVQDLRLNVGHRLKVSLASVLLSGMLAAIAFIYWSGSLAWVFVGVCAGRIMLSLYLRISVDRWLGVVPSNHWYAVVVIVMLGFSFFIGGKLAALGVAKVAIIALPATTMIVLVSYHVFLSARSRALIARNLFNVRPIPGKKS